MMKDSLLLVGFLLIHLIIPAGVAAQSQPVTLSKDVLYINNLEECVHIAFDRHQNRQISQHAVEIAEAQHQQALSSYWPRLDAAMLAARGQEDVNFIFPEETSNYTITGFAPVPIEAEVTVPEKSVKVLDRDMLRSSLNLLFPLYTGGKREALTKQTAMNLASAKEAARRNDLQLIYDVKRMYFGAILAKNLRKLGQKTFEQLRATLKLTEHFYQSGAGGVQKTDYLRIKIFVSGIQSLLEMLKSNEVLAKTALSNSMGLPWDSEIELREEHLPFLPFDADINRLVTKAYQFSPDWAQFELALKAAEAQIQERKSHRLPTIALNGRLDFLAKSYDAGLMTDANRESWTLGIAISLPLFQGFQTTHAIEEARIRMEKLKHEKMLFHEGLALQVYHNLLQITRAKEQVKALQNALEIAGENLNLTRRAYQHGLAEAQELLEAQLLEALFHGQHLKALYDYALNLARLELIIGHELKQRFQ